MGTPGGVGGLVGGEKATSRVFDVPSLAAEAGAAEAAIGDDSGGNGEDADHG